MRDGESEEKKVGLVTGRMMSFGRLGGVEKLAYGDTLVLLNNQ